MRGFTLNVRGSDVLHLDSMKRTLQAEILDPREEARTLTAPNPHFIVRDGKTKTLTTVRRDKTWGVVFDKRVGTTKGLTRTRTATPGSRPPEKHAGLWNRL